MRRYEPKLAECVHRSPVCHRLYGDGTTDSNAGSDTGDSNAGSATGSDISSPFGAIHAPDYTTGNG